MTGEADAVIKTSEIISEKVEIGDQRNMGFSGSVVSSGQGTGIVVATGENTELGKISTDERRRRKTVSFTKNSSKID